MIFRKPNPCIAGDQPVVRLCDSALSKDLFPGDYHCLGDNDNRPVNIDTITINIITIVIIIITINIIIIIITIINIIITIVIIIITKNIIIITIINIPFAGEVAFPRHSPEWTVRPQHRCLGLGGRNVGNTDKVEFQSLIRLTEKTFIRAQQPFPDVDPFEMEGYLVDGFRLHQPVNCPDQLYTVNLLFLPIVFNL